MIHHALAKFRRAKRRITNDLDSAVRHVLNHLVGGLVIMRTVWHFPLCRRRQTVWRLRLKVNMVAFVDGLQGWELLRHLCSIIAHADALGRNQIVSLPSEVIAARYATHCRIVRGAALCRRDGGSRQRPDDVSRRRKALEGRKRRGLALRCRLTAIRGLQELRGFARGRLDADRGVSNHPAGRVNDVTICVGRNVRRGRKCLSDHARSHFALFKRLRSELVAVVFQITSRIGDELLLFCGLKVAVELSHPLRVELGLSGGYRNSPVGKIRFAPSAPMHQHSTDVGQNAGMSIRNRGGHVLGRKRGRHTPLHVYFINH